MLTAAVLAGSLAAALVALIGTHAELRRLRRELRTERQHCDWQAGIIARREPNKPHGPRLWRHEPPRQG